KQLLIWHGEAINSLNPENGQSYWSVPLDTSFSMSIMAPRKDGDHLFAGGIMGKAALLKLDNEKPAAKDAWRGTVKTAVYRFNSTPFLEGGIMYGFDQGGQLRGVKLETGERLWETLAPISSERPLNSGTAFLVKNGDRFFLFSETGHLIIARL